MLLQRWAPIPSETQDNLRRDATREVSERTILRAKKQGIVNEMKEGRDSVTWGTSQARCS